jgi:hypothetical protein
MSLIIRFAICAALVLAVSCIKTKPGAANAKTAPIVTLDTALVGKVKYVNLRLRHVVANFPVGRLPAPSQVLNVYREGLKVGEVRVDDRWRLDDNVVADLITGEARVGDELKDR